MSFEHPRLLRSAIALACAALVAACSTPTNSSKVDYKTNVEVKSVGLEVPPDLSQLNRDSRYTMPGSGTVSAIFSCASSTVEPRSRPRTEYLSGTKRWLFSR